MRLTRVLKSIANHPLNADRKVDSVVRFFKWQLGIRLVPGPVVVPFVDQARLLVRKGQFGATGNIYTGLLDFEEMALLLHFLRPDDTFVDIGANVGVYTVLAGAVAGARCMAAEPVPATYADLLANIRINGIEPRCRLENVAVGAASGWLRITTGLDAMNYVIPAGETGNGASFVEVPVMTLDDVVGGAAVTVLKIDVEGFEREVLAGGGKTLADPSLLLVIMEVNYCTGRYGYDGALLHQRMADLGFQTFRYLPRERTLVRSEIAAGFNVVFVRHPEAFEQRLRSAPKFEIQRLGVKI